MKATHCFTRLRVPAVGFEQVIQEYGKIGIGHWCTHDTDVIPAEASGTDAAGGDRRQIKASLQKNG